MNNYNKKILYLGPIGSNSQKAASIFNEKLGLNAEFISVSTITKIIEIMDENDETYFAALPIENSIQGVVRETVDNLIQTKPNLYIQGEITLDICHCLLSKGKKEEIKTIVSITQAIGQCKNYIANNFPNDINIVYYSSTSGAAEFIKSKDNSYACIASELCADIYSLNVLDKGINDIKDNKTRFVIVSKKNLCKENKTRTSLVFVTENKPGALLSVLEVFKKHNLNLIYLESRPYKKKFGEYIFFADVDKGLEGIQNTLMEIESKCTYTRLLGSYCVL